MCRHTTATRGTKGRALLCLISFLCFVTAPEFAIASYPPATAYAAKTTVVPVTNNRTYGTAVAADVGLVASLVGVASVQVTQFSGADATAAESLVASLSLPNSDTSVGNVDALVGDAPKHLAMADGVLVLGAPGRAGRSGGARVWRLDLSNANTWIDQTDLGSHTGVTNDMGASVATAGGDVIVLGAPYEDAGKGAAYVFQRDVDVSPWTWKTPATKITAPGATAGDRFGAAVAISHEVNGPGNGWVFVSAPGFNSGGGAVFCYARVTLTGNNYGWSYVQTLQAASKTYGDVTISQNFGTSLAVANNKLLLATRAPAVNQSGFDVSLGDGHVYLLARDGSAVFSESAASADTSAVVTTSEGRWVLDAVLTPTTTPGGEPSEFSVGAGAVGGNTVVLGVTGRASENGAGGSVTGWLRAVDSSDASKIGWVKQTRVKNDTVTGVGGPVLGFGRAVAIDDGTAVVSSAGALTATDSTNDFHEGSGVITRFR